MKRVYLIGGGSGEDCLTIRAAEIIKKCTVIIYDRLIDNSVLNLCHECCKKIYVGKSVGVHSKNQAEINNIIIEEAQKGERVVRLKGGDSFVFGRGGEEALALEAAGIKYELIPGVTSAVAAPEAAGIPVTHRQLARSFHVYTGHTADNTYMDFKNTAQTEGTLVFLMSVSEIGSLSEGLMLGGKSGETQVAIIENGGCANQRVFRTRLSEAARCIEENEVKSPSVIVVGECAKMKLVCDCPSVGIVGTEHFINKIKSNIWGYDVRERGRMYVEPIFNAEIEQRLKELHKYNWLAFTSANGVRVFFELLKHYQIDIRGIIACRFAVVGEGTRQALADYGIIADLMPPKYTVRALCEELKTRDGADKALLLRAEGADAVEFWGEAMTIYSLRAGNISKSNEDYLVFGSSSGARSYLSKFSVETNTQIIAIGCVTERTIRSLGYECRAADNFTVDGIINKIEVLENAKNEKIKS